jgi:excisionase family DNA binding protein
MRRHAPTVDTGTTCMTPRFLKADSLAKLLSVSLRTIREWQHHRVIPYVKVGRNVLFEVQKVTTALEQFERKAVAS